MQRNVENDNLQKKKIKKNIKVVCDTQSKSP